MKFDAVVVGGGIAGLTAAACLAKSGHSVVLYEQQPRPGGLVQGFRRNGVYFDTGLRSIENSGIVFPMLKYLGIDHEFRKSIISIGIENQVIRIMDKKSLDDYETFLSTLYPEISGDIAVVVKEIRKIMGYMDVLYGIDNPALMDFKKNKKYLFRKLLPWLFRFLFTMRKINKLYEPAEDYMKRLTSHQPLTDIITQHFFKNTPASFALSYFSLYLDYHYPTGGTGALIEKLTDYITANGGIIKTGTAITRLQPEKQVVSDNKGNLTSYSALIWACDTKQLYQIIPDEELKSDNLVQKIRQKRSVLRPLKGGDSLFTVYLTINESKTWFADICTGHFFYTPDRRGLSTVSKADVDYFLNADSKESDNSALNSWVRDYLYQYFRFNTFEIAIPVLRDPGLAPDGKTGLEVSLFLDYELDRKIDELGWTREMRDYMENITVEILNDTIFPGIKDKVEDRFSSSPLTIERLTGNTHGAITGWAFTNTHMPAVNKMLQVNDAVKTILPAVFQAGQWTYSPSGFPMSVVTGKLAADGAIKHLKKR